MPVGRSNVTPKLPLHVVVRPRFATGGSSRVSSSRSKTTLAQSRPKKLVPVMEIEPVGGSKHGRTLSPWQRTMMAGGGGVCAVTDEPGTRLASTSARANNDLKNGATSSHRPMLVEPLRNGETAHTSSGL